MVYHVQFPGLGLDLTVNRVALAIGGFNIYWYGVIIAAGMLLAGLSPNGRLVEIVEIPEHPWFVGAQFHPEFKSRPNRPHPLFVGFVQASLNKQG